MQTFSSAWMATPADQDAAATAYVNQTLTDHDGQVDVVPLAWYWPRAIDHPDEMDQIPRPDAGNNLTPREYQAKWMTEYDHQLQLAGGPAAPDAPAAPPTDTRRSTWRMQRHIDSDDRHRVGASRTSRTPRRQPEGDHPAAP